MKLPNQPEYGFKHELSYEEIHLNTLKIPDRYETVHSTINFNHKGFAEQVKEELLHHGLSYEQLGKQIYLTKSKVNSLLTGKSKFEIKHITEIKKLFGM